MTELDILIKVQDAASAVLKAITNNFGDMDKAAQEAGAALGKAGESAEGGLSKLAHSEAFGLSRREFSHLSGAATEAFNIIDQVAGATGGKIGETIKTVSGLASAFAFAGPLGAGIAAASLAIGALVEAAKAQQVAMEESVRSNNDYILSVKGIAEANAGTAVSFNALVSALANQETAWGRLTNTIHDALVNEARDEVTVLGSAADAGTRAIAAMQTSAEAIAGLQANLDAQISSLQQTTLETDRLSTAEQLVASATDGAQASSAAYTKQLDDQAAAAQRATEGNRFLVSEFFALNPTARSAAQSLDQVNAKADALAKQGLADAKRALADATAEAQKFNSVIANLAQAAITPTSVSGDDATRMNLETQLAKVQAKMQDAGPQQSRILQQQATDIQNGLKQLGPYVDKWDEYARQLEALKQSAAQGVINPDWAKLVPADVLAKGAAAVGAWASAEEAAFYAGQDLNKINYDGLKQSVDKNIDDVISKFELLQAAESTVVQELEKLQHSDPAKYAEFLKAENLAPNTGAVDAAKKAYSDITSSADPAASAVKGIGDAVKSIPTAVTTVFDVVKSKTFDANIKQIKKDLASIPNAIGVNVVISYSGLPGGSSGASGATGGSTSAGAAAGDGAAGLGLARGGSFTVPWGFPNDSFPLRVSSGEHVSVTPANRGSGGGDIYISIDGSEFRRISNRRVRSMSQLGQGV